MRKVAISLVFSSLVIGLISCNNKEAGQEVFTPESERVAVVKTEMAVEKEYHNTVVYPATLFANREANLGSSLPGKIEKFYFQEGQHVSEGDVLVDLSADVYTQAVIEYDAIKKDFERIKRLREKESISEIEYDHLKAKLDASEVKTSMLRKSTQVTAPFSGVVVDYLMEEGENYFFNIALDPGYSNTSGILRLMQLNPLRAEIQVNEKDLKDLYVGQKVVLRADAYSDIEYNGKIKYIKPILSTMTHSATVEISIANPQLKLKPGMFAKCEIDMGHDKGIFVPMDAIVRQAGTAEDYVYRLNGNIANKVRINRKQTHGEMVLVDSLVEGDILVTKGKSDLYSGVEVNVVNN